MNGGCDYYLPSDKIIVTTPCIRIRHQNPSPDRFYNDINVVEDHLPVEVYPSPFSGSTNLYIDDPSSVKTISIYSVDGRIIQKIINIKEDRLKIGEDLLPGIYYFLFEFADGKEIIPISKM